MSEQNEIVETMFDDPKLRVQLQPGDRNSPQLGLVLKGSSMYPTIRVWTKDPSDQTNYGQIDGNLEPKSFFKMTELMRRVALSKEPVEFVMDNFGFIPKKGQPLGPKQIMSKIRISRDDQGVVRFSVTAGKSRPVIDFIITDDDFHNFYRNGQPLSEAENSQLATYALANMWERLYNSIVARIGGKPNWMKKNDRQGNQGGYNNNRGNQGGGYGGNQGGYNNNNRGNQGGGYNNNGGGNDWDDGFGDDIPM